MSIIFGIDFGTTNSALSINRDGKVEVVNIDQYNTSDRAMRSVIYFDESRRSYVGQEAINQYIDCGASGRFLQSIKAFLSSRALEYTHVFGKKYEVVQLVSMMLQKMKEKGEAYVGEKVDRVVMGRPVVFSENPEEDALAEQRLREAAILAGFKNIVFQFEPVAAALTFEKTIDPDNEKVVLIGDFGGGTSDFTVIRLRGGSQGKLDRRGDVLSLGGIHIGGDAFNSEVMWEKVAKYFGRDVKYHIEMGDKWMNMPTHFIRTLCRWHHIPRLREQKTIEAIKKIKHGADDKKAVENLQCIIEDNYGFMLFQAIEKAKCDLSSREHSCIVFDDRDLVIREAITRKEFERIIGDKVSQIENSVDQTIARSGFSNSQIDVVFITGGTSHIPCIQKIFVERFGYKKIQQLDVSMSVVHGLGMSADFLF